MFKESDLLRHPPAVTVPIMRFDKPFLNTRRCFDYPASFVVINALQGKELVGEIAMPRSSNGRYRNIEPSLVCMITSNLRIGEDLVVYGDVVPFGPYGAQLRALMDQGAEIQVVPRVTTARRGDSLLPINFITVDLATPLPNSLGLKLT